MLCSKHYNKIIINPSPNVPVLYSYCIVIALDLLIGEVLLKGVKINYTQYNEYGSNNNKTLEMND